MSAIFALPLTLVALSSSPAPPAPAPTPPTVEPITVTEALRATKDHIIGRVKRTAKGTYSAHYACAAASQARPGLNGTDEAYRWRCSLVAKGPHFRHPCTAEAFVSATPPGQPLRVEWITISHSCGVGPL